MKLNTFPQERGTSMIEVLVTIVIIVIGLLGLVGLQARLQVSEMESYQRAQALILVKDMSNRIATNRNHVGGYETTEIGANTSNCAALTATNPRVQADLREWCSALQGAGEVRDGERVGAMVGGRGCVEVLGRVVRVTVAWQGLAPVPSPVSDTASTCGNGAYDDASPGAACTGNLCRRAVTTTVLIPALT
jgi:type IV pilus assembly protein PilV